MLILSLEREFLMKTKAIPLKEKTNKNKWNSFKNI